MGRILQITCDRCEKQLSNKYYNMRYQTYNKGRITKVNGIYLCDECFRKMELHLLPVVEQGKTNE